MVTGCSWLPFIFFVCFHCMSFRSVYKHGWSLVAIREDHMNIHSCYFLYLMTVGYHESHIFFKCWMQNKILHNQLEALHIRLAEKERNIAGLSSQRIDSHGEDDLHSVIGYLRRSKEIVSIRFSVLFFFIIPLLGMGCYLCSLMVISLFQAETEISLLKQEKSRLQIEVWSACSCILLFVQIPIIVPRQLLYSSIHKSYTFYFCHQDHEEIKLSWMLQHQGVNASMQPMSI